MRSRISSTRRGGNVPDVVSATLAAPIPAAISGRCAMIRPIVDWIIVARSASGGGAGIDSTGRTRGMAITVATPGTGVTRPRIRRFDDARLVGRYCRGMRIGLMIGSDRERPRAERVAGLVDDVRAAEAAGFTSVW